MSHSTVDIFDELRQEIRMVKFPAAELEQPAMKKRTKKSQSVTLVMPNGKRVKQFKKNDDEDLVAPLSLAFEGKSTKGDVYVRADGKRVRLVKKKDKKRKEKLRKQESNQEAKRQLIECDWSEMSWEEAEAEQERIVRMSWQNGVVSSKKKKSAQKDASSVVSDGTCSTTEAETVSIDTNEDMEQDDCWDMESRSSSSCSTEAPNNDDDVDADEKEMNAFMASLTGSESDDEEEEQEEEEAAKPRLSSVQRMALKSQEALARAQYMKRLSQLANDLGNLKEERFQYVKMPRHHTQ